VIDHVDSLQSPPNRSRIADIPHDELHLRIQIPGPLLLIAVHLRRQVVQGTHTMTTRQQCIGEM
jgi:hypothetical protein